MTKVATVAELIDELRTLPPDATPITAEPPFDGVRVVAQANGKILFVAPAPVRDVGAAPGPLR